MRIFNIRFALPSHDPEQSLRFYVDGLLFRKIFENSKHGLWTVGLGDFEVSFVRAEDASLVAKPNSRVVLMSVSMDGIQDYYDRVRATGLVQIKDKLDFYPGEFWQFSVIDNNGYRICFNQETRLPENRGA